LACRAAGVLALLLHTLWGGAAAQAAEEPRRGGVLVYPVVAGEPSNYDCHGTITLSVMHRVGPHYSTLLKFDPDHYPNIIGDAAESWKVSSDGLVYTFTLRDGILFHDGSKFTSADVKASYERLRNPPSGVISIRQSQFASIASIETPDLRTVVFKLSEPNSGMLTIFASPYNCLYSAVKLKEDPQYPMRNVMGTGPFKFVEHVAGSEWKGERFDRYFMKGKPYLDGFRVANVSPTAAINGLIGGQFHMDLRGVRPTDADRIKAARGDQFVIQQDYAANALMLTFNTKRKPFDDPRVRRALSLALDRWGSAPALSKIDYYSVVGSFLRPGSALAPTEDKLTKLPGFGRDIAASRAEARRLLQEAGVSDLHAVLWNRQLFSALGNVLIDQWRQIGVTVTQELPENQRFFASYDSGNFDFVIDAFTAFPEDPVVGFAPFLSSDVNSTNRSGANDRELDRIYHDIVVTMDGDQRRALAQKFDALAVSRAYSIPLFWGVRILPMSTAVHGYHITPHFLVGDDLANVWLSP
jgi:peptide/nickel transport system substrate-binding protein